MTITRDDILRLLVEHKLFADVGEQPGVDTHIAWDSLSLTWFLTRVEDQYGLVIDSGEVVPEELASVEQIHAYLQGLVPDEA